MTRAVIAAAAILAAAALTSSDRAQAQQAVGFYNPATTVSCWTRTGSRLVCYQESTATWAWIDTRGRSGRQRGATQPYRPPYRLRVNAPYVTMPGGFRCDVTYAKRDDRPILVCVAPTPDKALGALRDWGFYFATRGAAHRPPTA
jgi:hypothetical protein